MYDMCEGSFLIRVYFWSKCPRRARETLLASSKFRSLGTGILSTDSISNTLYCLSIEVWRAVGQRRQGSEIRNPISEKLARGTNHQVRAQSTNLGRCFANRHRLGHV